jgi:peptide/nickel transport system substrate-binding protein
LRRSPRGDPVKKRLLTAVFVCFTWTATTFAAELTIGLGADVTTIDPHTINLTPNNNIAEQIFDPLVRRDGRLRLEPGLAESWRSVDDLTWEFKLRRGVKFHDGSDFTAADVVFSLDRPKWLTGIPGVTGGVLTYTQAITEKIVVDPYTIRLKTAAPYPYLPADLMGVMILSSRAAKDRHGADFDSGKATVGTGPFRFVRFARGDRIVLERNDAYWGPKSSWDRVTFRLMPTDATRIAALLAGDVQLIDNVPTSDYARLKSDRNLNLFTATSSRLVHLQLDSSRERSPFVTDGAGRPLDRNPLKDVRVRQAISKAINRQAIVERVMEGNATAAGQMIPIGFLGMKASLQPDAYDPDGARKLLVEAGYASGFGITLHGPNDRLVNDDQIVQTIAQMLAKVGLAAKVETMPYNVYIGRARNLEFSAVLQSWGAISEATVPLRFVAATFDKDKGLGAFNFGRYSNPKADVLLEQSFATINDTKRSELLQQAMELVIKDYGIIPLHFQVSIWAARKPLEYDPRGDERTYAHAVRVGK